MSTDLYGVRVLNVDGANVKLQVFLVYYDWDFLPEGRPFFLRALWDTADTRFGEGGALGDAITVDNICDEHFVDTNAGRYIKSVHQVSTKNYPVSGDMPTFYYERNGQWADEDKLTQGIYNVVMTDPKWAEHLQEGMAWGTTAYDSDEIGTVWQVGEIEPVDFSGKTVVLTGKMSSARSKIKTLLKEKGAKVSSAISGKTDYLIVGDKPGSKLQEATRYGVTVLDEAFIHES